VVVNSAIHHLAGAQMHADALRDSLRNPRLPDEPKPARPQQPRRPGWNLLHRLRPALA
jgi:hypothetical protein